MKTNNIAEGKLGYPYELPKFEYDPKLLDPNIDTTTMDIHYNKHHGAYVTNLNAALQGTGNETKNLLSILQEVSNFSPAIRNNGGGHFNHTLFWRIISPMGGGKPVGKLSEKIDTTFGSFEKFKDEFSNAAKTRFGSGWAWLSLDSDGKLFVSSTPNQDNPLMDVSDKKGAPILGLDVWEHAYYLKYQNRRPDYIEAWWNIVNWQEADRRFNELL